MRQAIRNLAKKKSGGQKPKNTKEKFILLRVITDAMRAYNTYIL